MLLLEIAAPSADNAVKTRLHGVRKRPNDLSIKIRAAILDKGGGAAASSRDLTDQMLVASAAQAEGKDTNLIAVLLGCKNDLVSVIDITISE